MNFQRKLVIRTVRIVAVRIIVLNLKLNHSKKRKCLVLRIFIFFVFKVNSSIYVSNINTERQTVDVSASSFKP